MSLCLGVLLGTMLSMPAARAQTREVVLRGGWLFDSVRAEVVRNNGIVVKVGKFFEVNADLKGRDLSGAQVIDLSDSDYILPGIFDLHAHYNINLFGKNRKDEYTVNPVIFLANGVTSTFPAGEYDPEGMAEARRRIDSGKQIGARIFNSGPYFGTARPGWNNETTVQQIYDEVDSLAAKGVAGLKAKGISPVHLQALIERAHLHGLTVAGHLDSGFRNTVNPRDAILMGIDRVEHFLGGDALTPDKSAYASLVNFRPDMPEFKKIVDLYLKYRICYDATITAYGYFADRKEGYDYWIDETKFFTPYAREVVKARPPRRINEQFGKIYWVKRSTIKPFFDAGGFITLGTDHTSTGEYLAGFGSHREIDVMVLSGIPPAAALKIATINGARALRVGDKLGSIEVGKLADLLVVTGNPLQNIRNTRNVRLVMKAGQLYDSRELLKSVEGKMGPVDAESAKVW